MSTSTHNNDEYNDENYKSRQMQTLLLATKVLAGKETVGISPKELAAALNTSPSDIRRIMANLALSGYAERLPSNPNLWRLGKAWVQIANSAALAFSQAQQQLQQEQYNYSRLAV
ncbi:MAG: hypothetical protein JKY55_17295 [Aliivibrio sp.]|uniref:hypothetical protein n=1 Tax=Aliivibrio sp. TaxID=1872443 RepID=UPI001A40E16F|nr:hypothetical protein [Aliivibrio sp.]